MHSEILENITNRFKNWLLHPLFPFFCTRIVLAVKAAVRASNDPTSQTNRSSGRKVTQLNFYGYY
jgi:hypothetical protein